MRTAIQLPAMAQRDPTPETESTSDAAQTPQPIGLGPLVDDTAPSGFFANARIQKAMGTYLPATVAFRFINFIRNLILARLMIKHQFGLMTLIQLAVNVMTPLCSFGLAEAITRYIPQHETRGTLAPFLRRATMLVAAFSAVSVGVMLLFPTAFGQFFYAQASTDPNLTQAFKNDAPALASASAVVVAMLVVYFFELAILKALRMFTALSVMETVHGTFFLLFTIAAVVVGMRSALTMTVVYAIALFLPVAVMGVMLYRMLGRWTSQHGTLSDDSSSRSLLRFGFWSAVAGVTWQVLVYYPSWYLNKVQGHEVVAVFNAARQIGNLVLIGAMSIVAVIASAVTKTWESRGREAADRQWSLAFRAGGLALFVMCAGIAIAKRQVMPMFGRAYIDGAEILPLQLLFFLLSSHLAFLVIHFQLIEKSRLLVWPWAVGVAANALLAWWLAGPTPAAIQTSGWWLAMAPSVYFILRPSWFDAHGLHAASWCGVFAIGAALAVCLALMRMEGRRLDRGSIAVVIVSFLLATRGRILGPAVLVVMLIAVTTPVFFSLAERNELKGVFKGAWSHVPRWGKPR